MLLLGMEPRKFSGSTAGTERDKWSGKPTSGLSQNLKCSVLGSLKAPAYLLVSKDVAAGCVVTVVTMSFLYYHAGNSSERCSTRFLQSYFFIHRYRGKQLSIK